MTDTIKALAMTLTIFAIGGMTANTLREYMERKKVHRCDTCLGLIDQKVKEAPPITLVPEFHFGEKVKVTGGFYKGMTGEVSGQSDKGPSTYNVYLDKRPDIKAWMPSETLIISDHLKLIEKDDE